MNAEERIHNHRVVIGIGTNISPVENMRSSLYLLGRMVSIQDISGFWKTPSVGSPGPDFLNAAVLVKTRYVLKQLRNEVLHPIENLLGRVRTQDPNAPRTIDLDPLVIDGTQLDEQLWTYAHMAVPVAELIPDFIDQQSGMRAEEIANDFLKTSPIEKVELDLHRTSTARDIV